MLHHLEAPGRHEVSPGVFERRFAKRTARLDCNTFEASFLAADNAALARRAVAGGGYGTRGTALPH